MRLATNSLICLVLTIVFAQVAPAQTTEIRKLSDDITKKIPLSVRFRLAETLKTNVVQQVKSKEECVELLGSGPSAGLINEVDFENQSLVIVFWELSGDEPKHWQVEYEQRGAELNFAFRRKKDAEYNAVNLLTLGIDAFVVPSGLRVEGKLTR